MRIVVGNNWSKLLVCFILILLFQDCSRKTIQQINDNEKSAQPVIPLTTINLPVYFETKDINALVNEQVRLGLKEGIAIEEGYKLIAQLDGDLSVTASDQKLNFIIPLMIEIFPKSSWTNFKAFGKMDLQLGIEFNIFQDQFLTKSSIDGVLWRATPKLSVLGVKLPVEAVANKFIEKYKNIITSSLDQFINKAVNLQNLKTKIVNGFAKPFYSSDDRIINLFASPSEIGLGPLKVEGEQIVFPLVVYMENVIASERPADLDNNLSFSIRPVAEDHINASVQGRIPMNYLEILVKENVENQSFGSGIAKINVDNISLNGEDKTIKVLMNTRGAFNGKLELSFNPVFKTEQREFKLEEFKLQALEGKKLDKALLSIVKGMAESKVKKEIENLLNELLRDYKNSISSYLDHKEVYSGMILKGQLSNWNISDIKMVNQILFFNVNTEIKAKLNILQLDRKLFQK